MIARCVHIRKILHNSRGIIIKSKPVITFRKLRSKHWKFSKSLAMFSSVNCVHLYLFNKAELAVQKLSLDPETVEIFRTFYDDEPIKQF